MMILFCVTDRKLGCFSINLLQVYLSKAVYAFYSIIALNCVSAVCGGHFAPRETPRPHVFLCFEQEVVVNGKFCAPLLPPRLLF